MTRQEFDETICDFSDLKQFCYDHGCDITDDVIEDYDLDNFVEEDIRNALEDRYWYDIRHYLNDIPTNGKWYVRNGQLEYSVLDETDFSRYLSEVLDWAEMNDVFDPDEGDGEEYVEVPVAACDATVAVPQEPEFEVDSAVFDALFPLSA